MIEPQCWGFEHAAYNGALLHTVQLAYPSATIVYYGEKEHLKYVHDELDRVHSADGINFRTIEIPKRKLFGWRRMPLEFSLCSKILTEASCVDAEAVIFCSVTNMSLLSLKLLIPIKRFNLPTVAIVHGCLSGITGQQTRTPWNWIIGLRRVLAMPHPRNLRLIALGDSILDNVKKVLPQWESQWRSLDLICLWPPHDSEAFHQTHQINHPVRFGYLGIGSKGFATFCQLAQDVSVSSETAQFIMAGFYDGPSHERPVCQYIPDIPNRPLPRKEFEDRVKQLSYVVWTAKPDHYRLTASATFLDALAFLKPGIYIRNNYIEYYFKQMGDIGYLCDNYEEMVLTVREIISKLPITRYQHQIENIQKGRVIFEPETLAPRLRRIVDDCSG